MIQNAFHMISNGINLNWIANEHFNLSKLTYSSNRREKDNVHPSRRCIDLTQ